MATKGQNFRELREKAKAILKANGNEKNLSFDDIDKIIEELSIYQIELEMQNEELQKSQESLEKEKRKYKKLYEKAPVPYITINQTGNIIDLNSKAAELFGKPREVFNFNSIFPFLHDESKNQFRNLINELFETGLSIGQPITFLGNEDYLIYTIINGELLHNENDEDSVMLTITDIIDEKQRHDEAIKLQEIKYGEIFNNTLDAIFLFPFNSDNKPGNFVEVNQKACELFEVDNKTLLSWSPQKMEYNPNMAYLNRASKEILKTSNSQFEGMHINQNGENIPIEIAAHKFQIRGRDWGVVLIRDITDRVEAQKKLQESNLRLNMAMDVGNLGWWKWDYEKNVLVTADKKPELLGYEPSEVSFSAQDYIDMIHPDDYEQAMESMRKHLRGESDRYEVEYRLKAKSGDYVWLYDVGKCIERADDGKPKQMLGVIYDISDRKAKEEKILKSEHDLSLLLTNLDDIVFEHAFDTTFLNVWTNQEENLPYPKEEIIGKRVNDIFPKPLSDVFTSAIEDAKQTGKSAFRTYKGMEKETRYYNAKVTPFMDEQTGETRFVSLVRDITQRREANLTIKKQNEELEELNATKDKFFSIISHDLKNPFNTILGFSSELLDHFDETSVEEQKKQIKIIHDSAQQNYSLLQNLLAWSRTQSKRMPFKPESIQIEDLIYENQQLFLQTAEAKGVGILLELHIDNKIHVYADRAMLNTGVRNLISNAIKYTPKGGEITLGCTIENDSKVRIFVKDNGVGIASDMIPKLFKIDETFSTLGTNNEQGTGLGLILVKEFVEQNNGTIYVESEKGKGSTFSIILNQKEAENKDFSSNLDYETISQKLLNLPKEQLDYYSAEIVSKFKSCVLAYSSRKVENFTKDLKNFSSNNKLNELESLSDCIEEAMSKYDINRLNNCLDDFKKLNVIIEEDMK
jgi:PAS domain S-box-containing protein